MDRGAKHVGLLCVVGSLLGLCVRALFPSEHNPIELVVLEAAVITLAVQVLARVPPVRELAGGATRPVRAVLSFLLFFTVFGHIGKVSQLTFPFSAWNMYDNAPGSRSLYRYLALHSSGRETPLDPAELFPSLGSFRLATTMADAALLATASDEELRVLAAGNTPLPAREDSVRNLDALCAALAGALDRKPDAIRIEKCELPLENPADLSCRSVYEWRPK